MRKEKKRKEKKRKEKKRKEKKRKEKKRKRKEKKPQRVEGTLFTQKKVEGKGSREGKDIMTDKVVGLKGK